MASYEHEVTAYSPAIAGGTDLDRVDCDLDCLLRVEVSRVTFGQCNQGINQSALNFAQQFDNSRQTTLYAYYFCGGER